MTSATTEPADASIAEQVLRFSPAIDHRAISDSLDNIPTYLFRLHAPHTVGITNTTEVSSPAWLSRNNDRARDLLQLPREDAAKRLNDHLRWRRAHERNCNLMSWSTSLLFLLQYGLYRSTMDNKPKLEDIHLLILDTRHFPRGTFIKDLDAMSDLSIQSDRLAYSLADLMSFRTGGSKKWYFGEYLSQGRLNVTGHCSQTSMQKLLDMGLFELCPALEYNEDNNPWDGWASVVVRIRKEMQNRETQPTTRGDVRKAITMAQACYGSRWTLPFAAMLLALQPRQYDDNVILEGVWSMFDGDEIESLDIVGMRFDPESEHLPELKLYRNMMMAIHSYPQDQGQEAGDVERVDMMFRQLTVSG